jgi:hypothetical protein
VTGRAKPVPAMRLVLRRAHAHGLRVQQDPSGAPIWVTGCPCAPRTGLVVQWRQDPDTGDVTVQPHRRDGHIVCTPADILAGLSLNDPRIQPFEWPPKPRPRPVRARIARDPAADSSETLDRLESALRRGGYAGRRSWSGRYSCPACGGSGDTGRGIKVTHQPHAVGKRKILIVCYTGRCRLVDILEPLGLTVAELCAADDTDDLWAVTT